MKLPPHEGSVGDPGAGTREWELASTLVPERLPEHVAVIMDGNGRWASRRSLPRVAGHKAGVEPVRVTVETCARLGVRCLTLYAFSKENWKRPRAESKPYGVCSIITSAAKCLG